MLLLSLGEAVDTHQDLLMINGIKGLNHDRNNLPERFASPSSRFVDGLAFAIFSLFELCASGGCGSFNRSRFGPHTQTYRYMW